MPTRSPGFSMAGPDVARDLHAHLVGDDVRERRLAEARRSVQEDVIERLAALFGGGDRDLQVLADAVLADVLVEQPRPQAGFVLRVFVDARRGDQAIVHHRRQLAQRLLQRPLESAVRQRLDRGFDSFLGERPMIPQVHERREQIVVQ